MRIFRSGIFKINISWISTALSHISRGIEVPFILYFLSVGMDGSANISRFGILCSIVIGVSGLLLPLATPTACGEKPRRMIRTVAISSMISYSVSVLLMLIIVPLYSELFVGYNMLALSGMILFITLCTAVRRIYQGSLLYVHSSWAILISSTIRVLITITLCIMLPSALSNLMAGMYLLIIGSVIDTLLNIILYEVYRWHKNISYKKTDFVSVKNYIIFSFPVIIFTIKNYCIIAMLTVIFVNPALANWIILYSFLNLFSGLYFDIDNITARYIIAVTRWYRIVLFPMLMGGLIFFFLFLWDKGRQLYFVVFQGATAVDTIVTLQYLIVAIIILFLFKQFLKGVLIHANNIGAVSKSAYANVLGLVVAGTVLYFVHSASEISSAIIMYFMGLCFEGSYILYMIVKQSNRAAKTTP